MLFDHFVDTNAFARELLKDGMRSWLATVVLPKAWSGVVAFRKLALLRDIEFDCVIGVWQRPRLLAPEIP